MRVDVPVTVEVRIARGDREGLETGMAGGGRVRRHDLVVTEAMTVQLRAPAGGFHIESLSPQTQWLDRNSRHIGDSDFGSWRWSVRPTRRGKNRLQLVVSARTVDERGLVAEAGLPDRVFDISVRINYRKTAARVGGWAIAAVIGGVLARYGEIAVNWIVNLR